MKTVLAFAFLALLACVMANDHSLEFLVQREVQGIVAADPNVTVSDCTSICDNLFYLVENDDEETTDKLCRHYCHCLLPTLEVSLELEQLIPLKKNIFKNVLRGFGELAIYYDWTGYELWQYTRKTFDPKTYDLAILLTGYDMYSRSNHPGMFGHGYEGSVCSENGVGAVEFRQPMDLIGMAHEIGHILGAAHDSEAPKRLCGPGTYQYGNLMNTYTKFDSPLRFKFSKCSLNQISEHFANLTRDNRNCLLIPGDHNTSVPIVDTTPDELCAAQFGEGWEMYRFFRTYGDKFCNTLDCVKWGNDNKRESRRIKTPDGLKCGKSKRCYNEKCVYVTHGDTNMSDSCPWGSQSDAYVTAGYGVTCSKLSCDSYIRMCCGRSC